MMPLAPRESAALRFTTFLVALLCLPGTHTACSQWTKAKGLDSGSVSCLAMSGKVLFAGTPDRGVFRSEDAGATWNPANDGLTSTAIYSLAAGGGYLLAGSFGSGVFVSTNEGDSWTAANDGLTSPYVYSLAVKETVFYAGTVDGVFRSTDKGTAWNPVNAGITNNAIKALAVINTNLFAATLGGGAFRTTDAGIGWTAVNTGLTNMYVQNFAACDRFIFAGSYGGLFRSDDSGFSWEFVDTSNPSDTASFVSATDPPGNLRLNFPPSPLREEKDGRPLNPILKDKAVYALAVSEKRLFLGSWLAGVLLSVDYGTSWVTVNRGLPRVSVYAILSDGERLFAGTYGSGIWSRPLSEMGTPTTGPTETEPSAFELEQNYPNPFNPRTTIRYSLPATTHVSLVMYNTLGEKVAEILEGEQLAGDHEAQFDGTGLASGTYFYRLSGGTFVQTKKAVLIR
jgi:photosystem II stability/assembly factor-like uncharacterized protein